MYKENDLVRVINFHHVFDGNVYLVNKVVKNWLGDNIYDVGNIPSHMQCKNLEPVTHLTTKEFITLVEDMGYEVNKKERYIEVVDENKNCLAYISKDRLRKIDTTYKTELTNIFFKVCYLYANTLLELREEKEQLYTLELPNNNNTIERFYNQRENHYIFDSKKQQPGYQTQFTQKEIDELPNQELIKTLVKKEVEENENE